MGRGGGRGRVVSNVDYTAKNGLEFSCKDGCGVAGEKRFGS